MDASVLLHAGLLPNNGFPEAKGIFFRNLSPTNFIKRVTKK